VRVVILSMLLLVSGLAVGCGSATFKSTATTPTVTPITTPSGPNVLQIDVNGGPEASVAGGGIYQNVPFATAKVCSPGSTSNCVTISGLLVETGATGLRIFDNEVSSLNLPAVNASNGSPAYDCVAFGDGTYIWGSVQQADVILAGETASKIPIHVISTSNNGVPATCSNGGNINLNTAIALGANGILGIGFEPTDCYFDGQSTCDASDGFTSPPFPAYYTCNGTDCNPAFVATANQVANPVKFFPKDNNGFIVELPPVVKPMVNLSGYVIFGLGTESNNGLASNSTVITMACDAFTTDFANQTLGITDANTCAGPYSAIDSGSNGIYFPNYPNLPLCPASTSAGDLSSLYCPDQTLGFTATIVGQDGKSKSASFDVGNGQQLLTSTPTSNDAVLPTLAGTNAFGSGFVWGLPFFYGKNVYFSIAGQTAPSGTPAGPWWAF
jgi:hypothetical protein